MPERLYQLRFDEQFRPASPQEVTPDDFAGLEFDKHERLSRFVREASERVYIRSPNDAAQYLLRNIFTPFGDFDQEEMWVLLLDNKLRVTHEVMIYRGTVTTTHIREAELLKEAVRVSAPVLILTHCYPSGDPTPSPLTAELSEAKARGLAQFSISGRGLERIQVALEPLSAEPLQIIIR